MSVQDRTRTPAVAAAITAAVEGRTLASAFAATVEARPDAVALRWREAADWGTLTWAQYADRAARVAAGLRQLGIERGSRVLLMMRNRPEFHLADVAVLLLGATPISVYNSSSPQQVRYFARHAEASVAIIEDAELCERFVTVRDQVPSLRHLVVVDDPEALAPVDAVHFSRLLREPPIDWRAAAAVCDPDGLATVIYTSGTTGPPKGVIVTHRQACWTVESLLRALGRSVTGKRMVSYLPMAHIAERMTTHYINLHQGTEVITCPDVNLVADHLRDVRPQIFFGVPRIFEKARSRIEALAGSDPEHQQALEHAVDLGRRVALARLEGAEPSPEVLADWAQADASTLSVVRLLLGFDEVEVAVTAAAPLPQEVLEFFLAIGLPLSEVYGLSESCGPLTWEPYHSRPGWVGRAIPGVELRLAPDGEVLARGGNVFAGYLNDPERTAEMIDADAWLHTGDVGVLDGEGFLRIIDRKKELIINAAGKNISPSNLEGALRSRPLISQACVVGDGRPYLAALLTLDPEVLPGWASARGIDLPFAELVRHADVLGEVGDEVAAVNATVSRVEQIKRFCVLPHDWPADSDELTATMKPKRRSIHAKYAAEISELYR
jgi:long-chain acyl-CoA synthetase